MIKVKWVIAVKHGNKGSGESSQDIPLVTTPMLSRVWL